MRAALDSIKPLMSKVKEKFCLEQVNYILYDPGIHSERGKNVKTKDWSNHTAEGHLPCKRLALNQLRFDPQHLYRPPNLPDMISVCRASSNTWSDTKCGPTPPKS